MFLCKKLFLSPNVKAELVEVSSNIYNAVLEYETFRDIHYYAVEHGDEYSFTHNGTSAPAEKLKVVNWDYLKNNNIIDKHFLDKYRLHPRYTSITANNFNYHRHSYNNSSQWIISIIHNPSGILKLGKMLDDEFFDFEYAKQFSSVSDYGEADKPVEILEQYTCQQFDIFFFNSWILHTFETSDLKSRCATFNPIVGRPEDYIAYIESL